MAFDDPMDETHARRRPLQIGNPKAERATGLAAAGGILAALAAASCCFVPFALITLGVSGAWIGNLTSLEPYQPFFAVVAAALIGYGFFTVYRKPQLECADDSFCARPGSKRTTKIALWIAAALFIVAIGFPKLAPLFL